MNENNPFAKLGLQKEVVESLHKQGRLDEFLRTYYRSIQLHIHPDRGGDSALAAAVNAAYNTIQRQPAHIEAWIKSMSNGNSINPEYLELIEGLAAKVEELQGVEKDYRKLQEQYAELLTSRTGDGTKADVRRASPKAKLEDVSADDFEESIRRDSFSDAPEVKRPKARRVDTEADVAARTRKAGREEEEETHSTAEPIALENIMLYDLKGKAVLTHKRLELDGEAVRGGDGKYLIKTQKEWYDYYEVNYIKDGKDLPSLPVMYAIIERMYDEKHPALASVVQDMRENWLCAGTVINYQKDFATHKWIDTQHNVTCKIPLGDHWLDEAIKKKDWKQAMQALFLPKNVERVPEVLNAVSGKRPYIWTPNADGRKSNPERAVWLYFYADRFGLYCGYSPISYAGRSRGVRVVSA